MVPSTAPVKGPVQNAARGSSGVAELARGLVDWVIGVLPVGLAEANVAV